MSDDIYYASGLSKKVRSKRKVQRDVPKREDSVRDVVDSVADIKDGGTDCPPQKRRTKTRKQPEVLKQPFRGSALWQRLLSLLTLAGIVILLIFNILVTLEKYELQEEVKKLMDEIKGKWCPDGWTKFGCSCYFKFDEKKTRPESRKDCQERGSDLVVINSKEEQEFVSGLNWKGESWIGLQGTKQTEWTWTWVDGSPLTETYWAEGHKNDSSWNYGVCCNDDGEWIQGYYSATKSWICEK